MSVASPHLASFWAYREARGKARDAVFRHASEGDLRVRRPRVFWMLLVPFSLADEPVGTDHGQNSSFMLHTAGRDPSCSREAPKIRHMRLTARPISDWATMAGFCRTCAQVLQGTCPRRANRSRPTSSGAQRGSNLFRSPSDERGGEGWPTVRPEIRRLVHVRHDRACRRRMWELRLTSKGVGLRGFDRRRSSLACRG